MSVKENSEALCSRDYALKKEAYERLYRRPLTYDFQPADIGGWIADGKNPVLS